MTAIEPKVGYTEQQAAAGTMEQLLRRLAGIGGTQADDNGATRGAVTIRIPAESLEEATHALVGTAGVRLADMFAGGSGGSSPRASRAAGGYWQGRRG